MANVEQISDVTDTAVWVAHYRALETERADALFKDPLAKKLVGEKGHKISSHMNRMSKYVQWAVISRTLVIDRYIENLLQEDVDVIVNLGAGLDTRPYRMNLPPHLHWIEVDYPKIIQLKNNILKDDQPRCSLERIEADLNNSEKRKEILTKINQLGKKILVLTEGVIPYLSEDQVKSLAEDLGKNSQIKYWIVEYLSPESYKHLKSRLRSQSMQNAPFKFYPIDWLGFFSQIGWIPRDIQYSSMVALSAGRRPPMSLLANLLSFFAPKSVKDKFLKMSGYILFQRKS